MSAALSVAAWFAALTVLAALLWLAVWTVFDQWDRRHPKSRKPADGHRSIVGPPHRSP